MSYDTNGCLVGGCKDNGINWIVTTNVGEITPQLPAGDIIVRNITITGTQTGGANASPATSLATDASPVQIDATHPTVPNQVLISTDTTHATWQAILSPDLTTSAVGVLPIAHGGTENIYGSVSSITTTTPSNPVVISTTPPTANQVLTASSGTAASWVTPSSSNIDLTSQVTGVLPVANGGTNNVFGSVSSITTTVPANPVAISTTAPTVNQVLTATSGNTAAWSTPPSVSLTSGVTGVLPIANGGTNNSFGSVSNITTTTPAAPVVISTTPPSSNQILTASSSTAAAWVSPPSVDLSTGVTGVLPIANGGTNNIYGSISNISTTVPSAPVVISTTAPSVNQVLTASSSSAASWITPPLVNLTSDVTGTLPIANGGTSNIYGSISNITTTTPSAPVVISTTPPTTSQVLTATTSTTALWTTLTTTPPTQQLLISTTTSSVYTPTTTSIVYIKVEMVGGGGGGGGGSTLGFGGGGGSGCYYRRYWPYAASYLYRCGTGGAGGATLVAGSAGSPTTFNAPSGTYTEVCVAGGGGGAGTNTPTDGAGAAQTTSVTFSAGAFNVNGSGGAPGNSWTNHFTIFAQGAGSLLGAWSRSATQNQTAAGSGGCGSNNATVTGSAGSAGIILITEYYGWG